MQKGSIIPALKLIEQKKIHDDRGYFSEIYNKNVFDKIIGDYSFVQDNLSLSLTLGTLRGLHLQTSPNAQAKLVRCNKGAIFDVAVDLRKTSDTFGKWSGFILSSDNGEQLFIPEGFAHGFITLTENCEVFYKCSDFYAPRNEITLRWNDPEINIQWPLDVKPILSDKDKNGLFLAELKNKKITAFN